MIAMPKCEDIGTLAVLKQVRGDPDLKPLKDLFQSDLDHFRRKNDKAVGDVLSQQQGACQYIDALLERIESSPEIIEKVRSAKPAHQMGENFKMEPLSPPEEH
jgi:hypothetical protein